MDEFKINIAPDFVCFHGQRCPTLLRDLISIKIIDGLTCYSVFNLIETHTIKDFDELFDACQLNQSNRFMCTSKPNKCLMTVAIGNGYFDCNTPEDELFAYTNNLLELILFSFLCNDNNVY